MGSCIGKKNKKCVETQQGMKAELTEQKENENRDEKIDEIKKEDENLIKKEGEPDSGGIEGIGDNRFQFNNKLIDIDELKNIYFSFDSVIEKWACIGSYNDEVKMIAGGKLQAATWENRMMVGVISGDYEFEYYKGNADDEQIKVHKWTITELKLDWKEAIDTTEYEEEKVLEIILYEIAYRMADYGYHEQLKALKDLP